MIPKKKLFFNRKICLAEAALTYKKFREKEKKEV